MQIHICQFLKIQQFYKLLVEMQIVVTTFQKTLAYV